MQRAKEVIKQVKRIEISTKQQVEGLITGNYHSIKKSSSRTLMELLRRLCGCILAINMD
jgi:hypothetical protein